MTEKNEIKKMGAKAQKNSGRTKYQKGDAKLYPFLVDIKESKEHFGLSRDVWTKVCTDALKEKLEPALMVSLGETQKTRLWIVDDIMFRQMLDCWLNEYKTG